MDWTPGGVSGDIEDRRDEGGGGGGGFGFGGFHLGIGGTLILLVLSVVFRTNLFTLFSGGGGSVAPSAYNEPASSPTGATDNDKEVQFISFVLDDVQHTWDKLLPAETNRAYRHAKLVLFRDLTNSGCGRAEAATGPFYCPDDEKVYIDLGFYDELQQRFGAPGEFAQAYVLAHEIGHHVQKILGIEGQIRRLQQANPSRQNALSVALELQADCLAGVWGHSTEQRNIVHEADIEQGMAAAAAVGDDRLQRMAGRQVSPESFTHGSSAQRTQWFRKGLEGGTVSSCTIQGNE
jgi:uncharacterized protein